MSQILQMSQNQPLTQSKGRIEYIDALRGFTMILVVLHHVASLCWHIHKGISVHDYLIQVRMPMFFFISGFVMYKANIVWNTKHTLSFFKKKIPVQLLSPLIFFCLFMHVNHLPFYETVMLDGSKAGYWFTFVLLIYYFFYATIRFLVRNEKWANVILLIIGCLLYPIAWPVLFQRLPFPEEVKGFLCMANWDFFLFFVLGTLAKKYFSTVEKWLDTTLIIAICVVIYILVNGFIDLFPINDKFIRRAMTFPGLVILFAFFRNKQAIFSKEKVLGRTLQYIGRRTLDVYLIHYFLIPRNLDFITLFNDHPMPIIEATVSLLISCLVVAGCLLIGNIIRLSPFLAHWVFGAKHPTSK